MRYCAWFGRLAVVTLLGLLACAPESRNTLPDEYRIAPDGRLLGQWRAESDADDFRIQVTQRDPLEYAAITTESANTEQGKQIHTVEYRLQFFNVNGVAILATQELDPGRERAPTWLFVTYRFSGDNGVTLFAMNEAHVRQLIQTGRLPGTVSGAETDFSDVLITASPAQLAALIRGEDAAQLFTTRIGPFVRQPL